MRLVVTEREPVVALRGGGQTWLADAQGHLLEQVDRPSRRLGLITIRGDDPTGLTIDMDFDFDWQRQMEKCNSNFEFQLQTIRCWQ